MSVVMPPPVPGISGTVLEPSAVPSLAPELRPPIRVLMIAWDLPSPTAPGVGVPGERLVQGLRERGAEIVLLVGGRAVPQAETLRASGGAGRRLRIIASFPRLRAAVRAEGEFLLDGVSRLSSVARIVAGEDRFDLIHAHDWMTFPAAVAARDASGRPFLAHVHQTEFARSAGDRGDPAVTRLEGEGLRRADRVICASSLTAGVVRRRHRVSESRIRVVEPEPAGGADPAVRCLEVYRELV